MYLEIIKALKQILMEIFTSKTLRLGWSVQLFLTKVVSACGQFHHHYTRAFFVRIFQQSQNVTRKTTFLRNFRTYNVDEIDTCKAVQFLVSVAATVKQVQRPRHSLRWRPSSTSIGAETGVWARPRQIRAVVVPAFNIVCHWRKLKNHTFSLVIHFYGC